jgi:LPPG:FO 2-phospho-L-lactate transferase
MEGVTRIVVLAGGFGGARMAHGFALLGAESVDLTVVGNTGDDLELHGLHISPDLDTVMYTLAGLANSTTGWGVADETWSATAMLERFGQPTWFSLGDRDLATHITRTAWLAAGESLTSVTRRLKAGLGVTAELLPMSDDLVRTKVRTPDGWLDFQDYFVRRRHADAVLDVRFDGVEAATPTADVLSAIRSADAIVIAPSNPFVSVAPILALPGVNEAVAASEARVVAVSPIVGGRALRGPAADMMRTLGGHEPTSAGIARHYAQRHPGLLDVLAIDLADAPDASAVTECGIEPLVTSTVIGEPAERARLAQELLDLAAR